MLLLYARRSQGKTNFATPGGWNREHIWPNSYGLDDTHPAYSDLHNLRPEDEDVNSFRGNKYFDRSETNHASYRFPAHPEAPECSSDFDSWNPPDSVKGDIARALFYMDVRYSNNDPHSVSQELELTERVGLISSTTNLMGRLSVLLWWHEIDPVDAAERTRNDRVFTYQRNRNPFVTNPGFVYELFWPFIVTTPVFDITDGINGILVEWSGDFTNGVLQGASELSAWSDLGNGTRNGDLRQWFEQPSNSRRFYQLRLSW